MNGQPRSILSENGEWILSAIKRNPEGLLLLAAGAALLLRTGSRPPGGARSMAAAYGGIMFRAQRCPVDGSTNH